MAWAKVDDGWFAHRKVVRLGMEARGLWITCLSWSCAQRCDFVPFHMAQFLAGTDPIDDAAGQLVKAGLWIEEVDGWRIHDWHEYQERSISEKRAEAGAKGGKASGEARRSKIEATPKQTKQADEANAEAGPSLPSPSLPSLKTRPAKPDVDPPEFVEFWTVYPRREGKGAARKAWAKAVKVADPSEIIEGARRYRDKPDRDAAFTAHASTWLNAERWADEATERPRATGQGAPRW